MLYTASHAVGASINIRIETFLITKSQLTTSGKEKKHLNKRTILLFHLEFKLLILKIKILVHCTPTEFDDPKGWHDILWLFFRTNLWRSGCSPALLSVPPQTAPWNVSARVCRAGTEGPAALCGDSLSAGFSFISSVIRYTKEVLCASH